MNPQTRVNLISAMHGEANAFAKYMLFAKHARTSGHAELADLFEKTAQVEHLEHFAEEAELAEIVGDDAANLRDAIQGESHEIDTMYREFAEQAAARGDQAAAGRFQEVRRDEMGHHDAFTAALGAIGATGTRRSSKRA